MAVSTACFVAKSYLGMQIELDNGYLGFLYQSIYEMKFINSNSCKPIILHTISSQSQSKDSWNGLNGECLHKLIEVIGQPGSSNDILSSQENVVITA